MKPGVACAMGVIAIGLAACSTAAPPSGRPVVDTAPNCDVEPAPLSCAADADAAAHRDRRD